VLHLVGCVLLSGSPSTVALAAFLRFLIMSSFLLRVDAVLFAQPGFRLILLHEALEHAPGKPVHPLGALAPSLGNADRAPTNLATSGHRIKLENGWMRQ
jgi:hypothetical protein